MQNLTELKFGAVRWIDIIKPDKSNLEYLAKEFNFNLINLEDLLATTQRSRVDRYQDYFFLVLLFPLFDRKQEDIKPAELDIFVGKDYVVTVHNGELSPLVDLFQLCAASTAANEKFLKNSQYLFYQIMKKLYLYCYPIIDHLIMDLNGIEQTILKGNEKVLTEQLSIVRRNIIDIRKLMQPQKNVLQRLRKNNSEEKLYDILPEYRANFDDLLDHTRDIWDQLENITESIEAIQDTHRSLSGFRLNEVMKVLTIFSVIFLPPTLIAALFGMNFPNMPFTQHPYGFALIFISSILSGLLTAIWIWSKKWW